MMLTNFVPVIKELNVAEAEYALLRVIMFFMPGFYPIIFFIVSLVNHLSETTLQRIHAFKNKYIKSFNAIVYHSNPNQKPIEAMKRVSRLVDLLTLVEVD